MSEGGASARKDVKGGRGQTRRRELGRREPAGRGPERQGLEARRVASRLLAAVVDRHVSLDGMLDPKGGNGAYLALDEMDRGLVRAIVTTALRRRPMIDRALARLLEKPLPEGARSLRFILETGAAQILYLDVPDRAAVDLAVEQANGDPRSRRFAGLVNALLRRLSREREDVAGRDDDDFAVVPAWFRERLEAVYGVTAPAILSMIAEPPTIDLTVKRDAEEWAERLGGIVLPTGTVRLVDPQGAIDALPGYADGAWWVQDAAAAIPVRLFGPVEGLRIAEIGRAHV